MHSSSMYDIFLFFELKRIKLMIKTSLMQLFYHVANVKQETETINNFTLYWNNNPK